MIHSLSRRFHATEQRAHLARMVHVTEVRTLTNLAELHDVAGDGAVALDLLEGWLAGLYIEVPEAYVRRAQPQRQYASDLLAIARRIRALDRDPRLALAAMGIRLSGDPGPSAYAREARTQLVELDLALGELAGDSHHRTVMADRLRLGSRSTSRPPDV